MRPLVTLEDAHRILGVMTATWGDNQNLPREMIRALQESGNVPFGAFEGDLLVGFVLGFLASDREGLHVHSHMLAVVADRRARGIGYALKQAQRAAALDAGVGVVRWTFDPLVAGNAHFNIAKLGASADRFERDLYGRMDDLLNRGERSDRLFVRWDLESAAPPAPEGGVEVLGREGTEEEPRPVPREMPAGGPVLVRIPRAYLALRERAPALAQEWREAAARAFEACLVAGMEARFFRVDGTYVFS